MLFPRKIFMNDDTQKFGAVHSIDWHIVDVDLYVIEIYFLREGKNKINLVFSGRRVNLLMLNHWET